MNPYIHTGGTYYTLNDNTYYGSSITALNTSGQAVGWTEQNGVAGPSPQAKVWTYTISGGDHYVADGLEPPNPGWAGKRMSQRLRLGGGGHQYFGTGGDRGGRRHQQRRLSGRLPHLSDGTGRRHAPLQYEHPGLYAAARPPDLRWPRSRTGTGTQFGGHGQAINDSGQVVGRMLTSSGGYDAAIWQNGTLTDLNSIYGPCGLNILPAGFTLNNATAIDNQGDIAGYGTDAASNTNQAFVIYAPMPGDANLDGKVDINDLTIVLAHYNQTGMTWTQGEFTGERHGGHQRLDHRAGPLQRHHRPGRRRPGPPCPSRARWRCWPPAWPDCWPASGGSGGNDDMRASVMLQHHARAKRRQATYAKAECSTTDLRQTETK